MLIFFISIIALVCNKIVHIWGLYLKRKKKIQKNNKNLQVSNWKILIEERQTKKKPTIKQASR